MRSIFQREREGAVKERREERESEEKKNVIWVSPFIRGIW